jgi:hypothetical protein
LVTAACVLGIVVNIGLNFVALDWGLTAILAARSIATLATAIVIYACNGRYGMRWGGGLSCALLLPLVVLLHAPLGAALLLGMLVLDHRTHWLFSREEEQQLSALITQFTEKLKHKLGMQS